jgi:hypothetical protein
MSKHNSDTPLHIYKCNVGQGLRVMNVDKVTGNVS